MSSIEALVAAVQKTLGKSGAIRLLSDPEATEPAKWISTGITLLDRAISKGIPVGTVIELSGWEQTGKSLLALSILAHAQQQGCVVALLDSETAATAEFAKKLAGLDPTKCWYRRVTTMEDTFQLFERLLEVSREADPERTFVGVIDSIAGLPTRRELEMAYDEARPLGDAQRVLNFALRRITTKLDSDKALLICTNQLYTNIGAYGDSSRTYGGKALRYFSHVRLQLDTTQKIKENNEEVGVRVRVTVKKSRFGPQGRRVEFPIRYASGIDDAESIVDFLYQKGQLGDTKGWVQYAGKRSRPKEFAKQVRADQKLREKLIEQALKLMQVIEADDLDETV